MIGMGAKSITIVRAVTADLETFVDGYNFIANSWRYLNDSKQESMFSATLRKFHNRAINLTL
jgi:hypothetical protein